MGMHTFFWRKYQKYQVIALAVVVDNFHTLRENFVLVWKFSEKAVVKIAMR